MTVMVKVDPKEIQKTIADEKTCFVSKDRDIFFDGCEKADDKFYGGWLRGPNVASLWRKCSFLGQLVWGWDLLEKNYARNFVDSKSCAVICYNPCEDR